MTDFYPKAIELTCEDDGKLIIQFSDCGADILYYVLRCSVNRNDPKRQGYVYWRPNIDFQLHIQPDFLEYGEKVVHQGQVYDFGFSLDSYKQVDENEPEFQLVQNVVLYEPGCCNEQDSIRVPRNQVNRLDPQRHCIVLDCFRKGTRLDITMSSFNKEGVQSHCSSPKDVVIL